tara:strand:- start:380 stop:583 length:204 start_codon:yes stop_codon:yes gene_type:complete
MINKEIINIQGNLYQLIRKFPEKSINLDKYENSVTLLKQFYHCDTMFRAKGYLWLCNKVINIDYEEF